MSNFRFYRRVNLFPGLSLNLSKSGPSITAGVRGAHVTVGSRGVRRTVGIPGTGAYWTSTTGHSTGLHSAHVETPVSSATQSLAHNVASGISTTLMGLFLVFLWAVFFGGK